MEKKKKSKKKIIVAVIVAILLVLFILSRIAVNSIEEVPEFEEALVEKRTLTTTISSTGKIATETTKNVTSQLVNYKVTGVNVKVGDQVNVGDILCTFDTADLAKTVSDLSASIDATNQSSSISIASAERSVEDAERSKNSTLEDLKKQLNLDYLKQDYENYNSALNTAKANLASNQAQLASLQSQLTTLTSSVKTAEAEKNEASQDVAQKQSELDANTSSDLTIIQGLQTALTGAQETLKIKENTLAEAQSKVTEVTSKINALQTEINSIPTQEAIVNQKRDLYTTAQKQYDDTQATLNSQVASAQSQLESAKVQTSVSTLSTEEQLNAYKKQLAETNLTSTVSGTVTAVKVKAGDYYTGGALITIEGIESFIVEAEIDEYDIADIEVGMEAIIKTDSTRDEELSGTVISVAPTATSTASDLTTSVASSATYTVKISIDTENDRLRLGMNSKINIITEKSTDALTVPYTAVTENADGKSIVTVLNDDGSEEEIEVTVGLESGYYTEISSDKIKEGMKVKIPTVDGTSSLSELLESMGATAGI